MELTIEYLKTLGFDSNHPENVFAKYYKHSKNPEYNITVEQHYKPLSNELMFNIDCWKGGENNTIIKRSSVHLTKTVEDFETCVKLCDIEL